MGEYSKLKSGMQGNWPRLSVQFLEFLLMTASPSQEPSNKGNEETSQYSENQVKMSVANEGAR